MKPIHRLALSTLQAWPTTVLLLACTVSAGCGGSSDDRHHTITPLEANAQFFAGYCAKAVQCISAGEVPDGANIPYDSTAACEDYWLGTTTQYLEPIQDAIERGTVIWHGEDAAFCLDLSLVAFETMDCATFWEEGLIDPDDPRCASLMVGTQQSGETCQIDAECAELGGECTGDTCGSVGPTEDDL